jgi:hypothetical protein
MKTLILFLLTACLSSIAQTNTITFTNQYGDVVSNAVVIKVSANTLLYRIPSGGGAVKLANLPPDLQQRFGYDPEKAAALDRKEQQDRAADLQQRMAWAAADAKYNRLKNQLEQGRRRIRGKVLQRISEGLLVDSGAATIAYAEETHYGTSPDGDPISWGGGTIAEGKTPGEEALSLVLLQDFPDPNMTDGGYVDIMAYPVGLYTYETVNQSSKTVRIFSANLDTAIKTLALKEQQSSQASQLDDEMESPNQSQTETNTPTR